MHVNAALLHISICHVSIFFIIKIVIVTAASVSQIVLEEASGGKHYFSFFVSGGALIYLSVHADTYMFAHGGQKLRLGIFSIHPT